MRASLYCTLRNALAAATLGLAALSASAVSLSLQPNPISAGPGAPVTLALRISGLDAAGINGLGSFDLEVNFDPAVLEFGSYTLGGLLGDLTAFEAIDYSLVPLVPTGKIQLTEVSLLDTPALAALQPDSFVLATLNFTMGPQGAGKGTAISIGKVWALGDAAGQTFDFDSPVGQVVRVVPEPSTYAMLLLGLGTLAATARRGSRQQQNTMATPHC